MMRTHNSNKQPFPQFPKRSDHAHRWRELARAIAADGERITDNAAQIIPPEQPGELVILGSGIETVGFTASDEIRMEEADYVFYCVADPATVVWIKAMRPDAFDLYVLYNDTKIRYLTYMQMTEAILHYVRKGKKVVAIYYGHPGIFVLSTHRAIQIARREGHVATMRPGISALDTLCADLGVDPSHPGMQTFEGTEMLIRRRRPDPGLHVVLWQVGLIGELGFRREGCLNSRFLILLDYLEEIYGPDQVVVNYVGSRYPGVEPVIERHTITSLREPQAQAKVTGISTFYLPPSKTAESDLDMLVNLGLIRPGQTVHTSGSPLRIIDLYGPKERKAFEDFAKFEVPTGYHWQADTAAARFILDLREDGGLRAQYISDPAGAVAGWEGGLTGVERRRLSQREAGAMQIAAKGIRTKVDAASARMLRELLTQDKSSQSLLRAVRRSSDPCTASEQWSRLHGHTVDWSVVAEDLGLTLRQFLYPWSGCYLAPGPQLAVVLHGLPTSPETDHIYINGVRIKGARYHHGTLYWRAEDGNATSGSLGLDLTPRGARRLVGSVWPAEEELSSHHHVVALEVPITTEVALASLSGTYRFESVQGLPMIATVSPNREAEQPRMQVTLNGNPTQGEASVGVTAFEVDGVSIPFSAMVHETGVPAFARGAYRVRIVNGDQATVLPVRLDADSMQIDDCEVSLVKGNHRTFHWQDGPASFKSGHVTVLVDPISLSPMLFGEATSSANTRGVLLRGMVPLVGPLLERRAGTPELGMPDWAWRYLVEVTAEASQKGGLFLWHGWVRSVTNLRRLRSVLRLRDWSL